MANLNGFDANEVDPNVPFETLPAGDYVVHMVASETKPTKNGKGSYLECVLEVIEGEKKGAKLWDRLNLVNPNPDAVKIAKGTLSAICRAVNVMKPKDSCELHNLPMVASVKVKKREDNGEPTNEIKGYKKKVSAVAQQANQGNQKPQGDQAQQVEVNRKDQSPPWKG